MFCEIKALFFNHNGRKGFRMVNLKSNHFVGGKFQLGKLYDFKIHKARLLPWFLIAYTTLITNP